MENGLELPGTFTFERRASLGPADKVLNFAERDRQGKKTFSGGEIFRGDCRVYRGWAWEKHTGPRGYYGLSEQRGPIVRKPGHVCKGDKKEWALASPWIILEAAYPT